MPRNVLVLLLLITWASLALADKQQEGIEVLSRAIETSNIRAEGAPPFTLKATFHVSQDGQRRVGTYSETWVSKDRWRREIASGTSHRIEVVNGRKRWVAEDEASPPFFGYVIGALQMGGRPPGAKVKDVANKRVDGIQAHCVHLETKYTKEVYCVAADDATLLNDELSINGDFRRQRSISYAEYAKFGNHLFPRILRYGSTDVRSVDIAVSAISAEALPDSTLFSAPTGGLELGNCPAPEKMTAPRPVFNPDPPYPENDTGTGSVVVLSLVVDNSGTPHNIRVARTGGRAFDDYAVRTVQMWKFQPAMCLGESMATAINVEVSFRRSR